MCLYLLIFFDKKIREFHNPRITSNIPFVVEGKEYSRIKLSFNFSKNWCKGTAFVQKQGVNSRFFRAPGIKKCYYFEFSLYSLGMIPISFLNTFEKYFGSLKPKE